MSLPVSNTILRRATLALALFIGFWVLACGPAPDPDDPSNKPRQPQGTFASDDWRLPKSNNKPQCTVVGEWELNGRTKSATASCSGKPKFGWPVHVPGEEHCSYQRDDGGNMPANPRVRCDA